VEKVLIVKTMKRVGNLYQQVCSIGNIKLAEKKARKGKSKQHGVRKFDRNKEDLLINLHHVLLNKSYKTSNYTIFKVKEKGKIREIYRLPYYPDRICHHAILNILEPIFLKCFIKQTYSCIKKRGIHLCLKDLNKDVKNYEYCLKLDIKKFYPSINNEILKKLLLRKFKDRNLLNLIFEIIDSNVGLPIGNYCSQFFANFYLTYFDHWIKEELKLKYFRYCDDIVILGNDKNELRIILNNIKNYLWYNLKLELSNYQIFPIKNRGIDFVGYVSYSTHIKLRKTIKKNFIKMIKYNKNNKSIASYNGWINHCNGINLKNKYIKT